MSNTIKLNINATRHSIRNISTINPDKIRKILLSKGYEKLILVGIPIKECISQIILWIDELDVDFFIEGCQHLEELISEQEEFEHNLFLGGGLLTIKASINRETTKVTYRYCPGLDKENLIYKTKQMSREEYLWQMRNIVYDLLDVAACKS